jgi:hypothetical protein
VDQDPDPGGKKHVNPDPDPGGKKTRGSGGSGTLFLMLSSWVSTAFTTRKASLGSVPEFLRAAVKLSTWPEKGNSANQH